MDGAIVRRKLVIDTSDIDPELYDALRLSRCIFDSRESGISITPGCCDHSDLRSLIY